MSKVKNLLSIFLIAIFVSIAGNVFAEKVDKKDFSGVHSRDHVIFTEAKVDLESGYVFFRLITPMAMGCDTMFSVKSVAYPLEKLFTESRKTNMFNGIVSKSEILQYEPSTFDIEVAPMISFELVVGDTCEYSMIVPQESFFTYEAKHIAIIFPKFKYLNEWYEKIEKATIALKTFQWENLKKMGAKEEVILEIK
jgi:hypothetical protein